MDGLCTKLVKIGLLSTKTFGKQKSSEFFPKKKSSLDIFQFSLVNLHDFLFDVSRSVQFFRNTLVRILSISICFLLSTFSFMRMIVACPQYMCFVCFNIFGITVNISQIDLGMYVYFFWDWILGFDFLSHPYRCSNRFLFDDFNWNMISFFFWWDVFFLLCSIVTTSKCYIEIE